MFGPDSRLVATRETSFKPLVAKAIDRHASKCNLGSIGLQEVFAADCGGPPVRSANGRAAVPRCAACPLIDRGRLRGRVEKVATGGDRVQVLGNVAVTTGC